MPTRGFRAAAIMKKGLRTLKPLLPRVRWCVSSAMTPMAVGGHACQFALLWPTVPTPVHSDVCYISSIFGVVDVLQHCLKANVSVFSKTKMQHFDASETILHAQVGAVGVEGDEASASTGSGDMSELSMPFSKI